MHPNLTAIFLLIPLFSTLSACEDTKAADAPALGTGVPNSPPLRSPPADSPQPLPGSPPLSKPSSAPMQAQADPQMQRVLNALQSLGDKPIETLTAEEYAKRRAAYVKSGKGTPPPGATPVDGE